MDGQASSNLLENFRGLPTPLKCAHMHKQLSIYMWDAEFSPRESFWKCNAGQVQNN